MRGVLFLILSMLFACGQGELAMGPGDYVSWIRDESNGYKVERKVDGIGYSAQLKTPEYIMLVERGKKALDSEYWVEEKERLNAMHYITFKIHPESGEAILYRENQDQEDYFAKLGHYLDDAQLDFWLSTKDGQKIPCQIYHFERTFNISNSSNILLGFPRMDSSAVDGLTLNFENSLMDTGLLKFRFSPSNEPKLLFTS